jgi:hypothetical protein
VLKNRVRPAVVAVEREAGAAVVAAAVHRLTGFAALAK